MSTATLAPIRPSVGPPEPAVTPEQLLKLNGVGRQGRFEWVNGRAVRKPMSVDANLVAGRVAGELYIYLRGKALGDVLVEQEFECFPLDAGKRVRIPDLSFVLSGRLPTPHPTGYLRLVPDLAVEVVSANDLVYNPDEKLEDYRSAGFPLTWVINPDSRVVRVHALGRPIAEFRDGDTLGAEPLLPGFAAAVTDLLPRRAAAV